MKKMVGQLWAEHLIQIKKITTKAGKCFNVPKFLPVLFRPLVCVNGVVHILPLLLVRIVHCVFKIPSHINVYSTVYHKSKSKIDFIFFYVERITFDTNNQATTKQPI